MLWRWGYLQTALTKAVNSLTAYEWVILPYVATKNDKPTPEAQNMAQLVDDCLYARPELRQGRWELDFDGAIKNVAMAFMRGESVLEIDWGFDAEGSRWVPRRYRKILPKYYAWTTQSDQPDALMLYPNGTGQQPCIPFPENKFLVALGETLGDHPIFANKLVALIPWYIAAEFGLKEALNFISHYAQPIKHVKYGAAKQYETAVNMMKKFGNNTWLVSPKSLELEIINASQNGNGSSPHLALLQAAQNQVDMVIGGQKLASGTADTGANSRALGEVHNEVRKEVVESMADFVKRILNTQLIPAILRLNLGELPEHLPSIEFNDPNSHADESKLNFVMRVLDTIPVAKQWPYEQLNIPMPEEGAELFEAVGSTPYSGSGTSPFDEDGEDDEGDEDDSEEGDLRSGEEDDEINAADSRRLSDPVDMPDGGKCYTRNCKRHGGKKEKPEHEVPDELYRKAGKGGKKGKSAPKPKPRTPEEERERNKEIERTKRLLNTPKGSVHFDNRIPTRHIKEYNDALEEMLKKYPASTLNQIGSNDAEDDSVLATSLGNYSIKLNHDKGTGGIFNLRASKAHKEGEKIVREAVGDTTQGGSIKALTIHEYGHLISRAAMNSESQAWEEWKVLVKNNRKKLKEEISLSAGKTEKEAFAECFAFREYENGNLDKVVPGMNKAIDKVIAVHTMKNKKRNKQ